MFKIMKTLVVLAGLVALCVGNAIPLTPGDNSHYVEGQSRYIWMPDGEGNQHLVDLEAPVETELLQNRNGANNAYWLFTRQNPNNAQILVHGNTNSVWSSNYLGSRALKVIVHGWRNNGNTEMNPLITGAFLATQDCNVIVVDWRALAGGLYSTAAAGVPGVGEFLGQFLTWLLQVGGGNWNNIHLVGFSLGAHIVGNAGRMTGGRIGRITGLDPAGPGWSNNGNALNRNAGQYVEAIHTDGGSLGIYDPIADADFYPNGGRHPQPGCFLQLNDCSHGRATELFAATVYHNHLVGRLCPNIWEAQLSTCFGAAFPMGNGILNKRGSGLYGLITGSQWPY